MVRIDYNYVTQSFSDVEIISNLTFENKNKGKISHLQKARNHPDIAFIV